MRKTIALFLAVAFTAMIAGAVYARTLEEERDAVRDYLKVLDAKIIKHRKAGNTAVVKKLQGDKAATLRRWEKVKAELAAPLPPPPSAPLRPVVAAPAAPAGLFGLGLNSVVRGDYIAGTGLLGTVVGRGDLLLDDFVGLGPIVGLSAKAVKYSVGIGGLYGRDSQDRFWRAIPIYFGGVIDLPADLLGGVESYLSGGLNYPISGSKTSAVGGEIYYGIKGDLGLGLGGKTSVAVGWSAIRTTGSVPRSSRGISISIGQDLAL